MDPELDENGNPVRRNPWGQVISDVAGGNAPDPRLAIAKDAGLYHENKNYELDPRMSAEDRYQARQRDAAEYNAQQKQPRGPQPAYGNYGVPAQPQGASNSPQMPAPLPEAPTESVGLGTPMSPEAAAKNQAEFEQAKLARQQRQHARQIAPNIYGPQAGMQPPPMMGPPLTPRQMRQQQRMQQMGGMPGQDNPWIKSKVNELEQAKDVITNDQGISEQQRQYGLAQVEKRLNQLDPHGQYGKGSLSSLQTPIDKFVAQNVHIFQEHGFAVAVDSKGTPHFHKLDNKQAVTEDHLKPLSASDKLKHLDSLRNAYPEMSEEELHARALQDFARAHGHDLPPIGGTPPVSSDALQAQRQQSQKQRDAALKRQKEEEELYLKVHQHLTKKGKTGESDTAPTHDEITKYIREMRSRLHPEPAPPAGQSASGWMTSGRDSRRTAPDPATTKVASDAVGEALRTAQDRAQAKQPGLDESLQRRLDEESRQWGSDHFADN